MTTLTTWDVFEDLRAAQDEMLRMTRGRAMRPGQQFAGQQNEAGSSAYAWAPALEISERKDAYLVSVELPGVKPGDVQVTFEDGLMTIQGERHFARDASEEQVHRSERCYGAFRRSITLPSHVEADKIEASAQDGVLQIFVPKAQEMQAKRIQVRVGQGNATLTSGAAAKNSN
jgi:HSP20 family protein